MSNIVKYLRCQNENCEAWNFFINETGVYCLKSEHKQKLKEGD